MGAAPLIAPPEIATDRLRLRAHSADDLDAVAAMSADAQVMARIGGPALRREDVWNRLLRYRGHWTLLGYGLFVVEERATGAFVGETGHADFHRDLGPAFDGVPEAAWVFARAGQGRGYAAEAAAAAHRWLDATHAPARTVCLIAPDNAPSLRLADRLGYQAFGSGRYREQTVRLLERRR